MTSSSSPKSPDSDDEFKGVLPPELVDAKWLKDLCRSFYAKGFERGWTKGIHDACASSVVNDSRPVHLVVPEDIRLIQTLGGKRNG